ncbi:hypothetical protein ATPR_3519 [Acetobacter tropicalis NBRC 101654]|uniref:Transcriptional regulator LysR n=1 Tax=Acetobacter tropicalis NBRC 101654 TaxID=749388 RepID=F7VJH0_9PROT|nr:hypothetical protein ATPR_3519 [Acetobacter tropicalis NBRC 101654]
MPLDLRIPAVSMVWSARNDRDPASVWLREQTASLIKTSETTA